jgi:hypothetical protein
LTAVALYYTGPRWEHSRPLAEQEDVRGHFEFLVREGLADDGGPFWRGQDVIPEGLVGLVVFPELDVEEAREVLRGDPSLASGVMRADVLSWYR